MRYKYFFNILVLLVVSVPAFAAEFIQSFYKELKPMLAYYNLKEEPGYYKPPIKDGHITSSFGSRTSPFTQEKSMHTGVDIANYVGTPVYASANGTVVFSGYISGYRKTVVMRHDNQTCTVYSHINDLKVKKNMSVSQGVEIGKLAGSGAAGPHIHFEIRPQSICVPETEK